MSRLDLDYAGSAAEAGEYPRWRVPEIALAGRSNAGKSSLLNALAGARDLARVSKTPGRTRRLHFFCDKRRELALVDLPGYGFAKASRQERSQFAGTVERYLAARENLCALLLVMDVRRAPEADEQLLAEFATSRGLGFIAVATKVDKLGRAERARLFRVLGEAGLGSWLPFSATTNEGRDAVIDAVELAAGRRSA